MQELPYFHVDAFTSRLFAGNPAGVVLLEQWLPDDLLGSIAAENRHSDTAFLILGQSEVELRWFTPVREVDLCGHATLAAAHVLFEHLGHAASDIRFRTKSGPLIVSRAQAGGNEYTMDFPRIEVEPIAMTENIVAALRLRPTELYRGPKLVAVVDSKREVHACSPDFAAVAELRCHGVIVTAPGASHDFVSRFFAPEMGVPEDPVTGSAHCILAPYWAKRLGKNRLAAHQVSARGGEMVCEVRGDRVLLTGRAITYMVGRIRTVSA